MSTVTFDLYKLSIKTLKVLNFELEWEALSWTQLKTNLTEKKNTIYVYPLLIDFIRKEWAITATPTTLPRPSTLLKIANPEPQNTF